MYLISVNIIIWYFLYIFWNGVVFFSPSEVCTEHYCQHSHQEKYDQNWFIISKTYTWDTAAFGRLYLNTGIGHKPWFKFPGNRSIKALKKKKSFIKWLFHSMEGNVLKINMQHQPVMAHSWDILFVSKSRNFQIKLSLALLFKSDF